MLRTPLLLSAIVCGAHAPAQQELWRVEGSTAQPFLGPIALFGDVDGDGWTDLATGAGASAPTTNQRILILSGRDGSALRTDVLPLGESIANIVSAGDVDGDGIKDYAARLGNSSGPLPGNLVDVRSGADGHILWQRQGSTSDLFGAALAGDLDVNGDGRPDLLVNAPREAITGAVHVYDHRGLLLYKVPVLAYSIAALGGDLDGDGADDFLVGQFDASGANGVFVYSGRDGAVLRASTVPGEALSDAVIGCGDVDGDGALDYAGVGWNTFFWLTNSVRVFSGGTGQSLLQIPATGGTLAAADLDADGISDLVVGPPGTSTSVLQTCLGWSSLRSGLLPPPFCVPNGQPGQFLGHFISTGPSPPGDPFAVLVISSIGNTGGRVALFSTAPEGVQRLGAGCTGTLAQEPRIGITEIGTGYRLHVSGAPASAQVWLALGLSTTSWFGLALPLSLPAPFSGCSLYTSVDVAVPLVTGSVGIDRGYAFLDVPFSPLAPSLVLHGQWIAVDSAIATGAATGALTWQHWLH